MAYFQSVTSFNSVNIDPATQGIDLVSFCNACDGVAGIFDKLGSGLGMIKSDIVGNVTKIRTKHAEDPAKYTTLQSIVEGEKGDKKRVATEGMLWLKRTLEFTAIGLRRSVENPAEELSVSFNAAYSATLAPFHSFVVRPVFSMAMRACPTRKDFYEKLGNSAPGFDDEFKNWLSGLEKVMGILSPYYEAQGLAKGMP
ncbi:hypothetical protein HK101_010042 [Irineochytrium annulatum]|nr:hypothetical protein HK101_010042 [Irineochytrium annulatum]